MEKMLPDKLREPWPCVEQKKLLTEQFMFEQEQSIGEYRTIWTNALVMERSPDLQDSLLRELGTYTECADPAEVRAAAREQ